MVQNQTTNFRNFTAQLLRGSIALAPVTLAFFRLDIDLASITGAYLIVTVVLSPMGSFIASAVVAFLLTSSIVMRLIRSLRAGGKQCERALSQSRPAVQRLLHREIQWHEYGALDLPFDHRCSWGTDVGFRQ